MKILIVDDNPGDLKLVEHYLKKAGYDDLLTAATGKEGLTKARDQHPDIVIVDTLLPDMNGFEVVKAYKHTNGSKKAIMVTGSIDALDAEKARLCGADDYVVKITDMEPVIKAVKKLS